MFGGSIRPVRGKIAVDGGRGDIVEASLGDVSLTPSVRFPAEREFDQCRLFAL